MKPVQRAADLEKLPINCNKFNKKQINLDNSQTDGFGKQQKWDWWQMYEYESTTQSDITDTGSL